MFLPTLSNAEADVAHQTSCKKQKHQGAKCLEVVYSAGVAVKKQHKVDCVKCVKCVCGGGGDVWQSAQCQ